MPALFQVTANCADAAVSVLGVPFEKRGKRMDECLQLVRALWTQEFVNFKGDFYDAVDWTGPAAWTDRPSISSCSAPRRSRSKRRLCPHRHGAR